VLEGRNSAETKITDIMTPKDVMLTIDPSNSVMEAMEIMVENQIRHLPVVADDKLVGMVSIRDVVGRAKSKQCLRVAVNINMQV